MTERDAVDTNGNKNILTILMRTEIEKIAERSRTTNYTLKPAQMFYMLVKKKQASVAFTNYSNLKKIKKMYNKA